MNAAPLVLPPILATLPERLMGRLMHAHRHMRVGLLVITKEWGEKVLKYCNDHNRSMTQTWRKIAGALSRHAIEVNGETVVFSQTGALLNGQNRIRAVVSTGIPFPTLAVWGAPDSAFPTYDSGKPRSPADVLSIAKYSSTHMVASALAWQIAYEGKEMDKARKPIPNDQIVELAMAYPEIVESARLVSRKYRRVGFSPSLASFLHCQFKQRDAALTEQLFDRVMLGVMVPAMCHEALLIRRLKSAQPEDGDADVRQRQRHRAPSPLGPVQIAALTIKTWNALRSNAPQPTNAKSKLLWTSKEAFPEIQ